MKREVKAGNIRIAYELMRTARKNILIKALPEGKTRVYAPSYMNLREVDRFVAANAAEIAEIHRRLEEALRENRVSHPVSGGSRICIEGRGYSLRLKQAARTKLEIAGDECVLSLKDPESEENVRAALKQTLSKRALVRIREELIAYAPKIGVTFGRIAIRDQRSRWGSCSAKHNLNFNWKLIMAPEEALRYVVIHELCHLIEFNHSARFWSLVSAQMPEYDLWKKWLKNHGSELGV